MSPRLQGSRIGGVVSEFDTGCGEKNSKRRRLSSAKVEQENKSSSEETLSALPCLVTLDTGVRISSVAAGGRHTLALSGTPISFTARLCNYISHLHSYVVHIAYNIFYFFYSH